MNTKVTANRFAETAGQVVGNLKGSKKNFQLSDVLNIHVSVIGTYKVLCPLLYSALPGWGGEFQPVLRLSSEMQVSAISLNLELFKVNSSLSSENGWEEKVYKA